MWKASWKSLMGHKVRLLLSALSVVLGIAFLSLRKRSHGSSLRKRRQESNVAPPHA